METMLAAEVPAGPIYSAAEMVTDQHFRSREMVLDLDVVVDGKSRRWHFRESCRSSRGCRGACAGWPPSSVRTQRMS